MALYPGTPVPSHVSAPEIIDPMLLFQSDSGYSVRRARTSRPRRRWTLEYLGQSVANVRMIRNFLYVMRGGVTAFSWFHPTGLEIITVLNTTPVTVQLVHGMTSGMWVAVNSTPNPSINGQVFQITIVTHDTFTLNGSTGAGITGTGLMVVYVPKAIAILNDNTFPSPETLIGPDRVAWSTDPMRGFYNFSVQIEEQF
jgi:phage-related protein